jgi:cell division protein FtsI/penicillin-binding protein 2
MVGFFCLFLVIMGSLILRIAKISVGENASEAAAIQSRRTVELCETRAGIFDRNLEPLVNKNSERRLLVFPDILDISVLNEFFDRDSLAEVFSKKEPSVIDTGGKIVEGAGIYNFSFPKQISFLIY